MSIELTTQVLLLSNNHVSPIEKHILTVLCFRANQHHEVYSTIAKLILDCGYSKNTVEKSLKNLRDKGYLSYTGKMAPKSKRIPVYRINLNNPTAWGDKNLITPYQESKHPILDILNTPPGGIRIDHNIIDNRKDIDCFFKPTQEQLQNLSYFINSGHKIPNELQTTYLWMMENKRELLPHTK